MRAPLFACIRLEPGNSELNPGLAVARDFSPRVMQASEREVLVDVSGLGRLIGPPAEIARQLAHALFDAGVKAGVALGPTQTVARLLATQYPDYPIVRLPELPVSLLQPLESGMRGGVTPAMNERDRLRPYETFERWGIVTLGDLAALPAPDLASRLGRRGIVLQQLARGLDLRPFVPDPETPRFIERLELDWPIDTLEPLSFVFARLLDPLSIALERADRGAIAVCLELRLTDRATFTRVLPLPAPMRDPRVLRTLLLLDLESHPPSAAVDIVSIELDPAPARITRFSLLERALPSPETLSTLTARLSALAGQSRVGSAVLLDSHAPDAFQMTRFDPERVPAVPAFTADATGVQPALRRQRMPLAIRVAVERGRPVHIASSKRGIPYGAITQAAGPWRLSGGWWCGAHPAPDTASASDTDTDTDTDTDANTNTNTNTDANTVTSRGWSRNEWDVALKSGAVCRIYQDRTTDRWFLDGVYD